MKRQFYSAALAAVALSLTASVAQAQVKISCKLNGYDKDKIIVAYQNDKVMKQDTVDVKNGAFTYVDNNRKQLTNYYVMEPGNRSSYMPLFAMPGQNLKVWGSMEEFHFGGTALYDKVNAISDHLDPMKKKQSDIMKEYRTQVKTLTTEAQKDSLAQAAQTKLDKVNSEIKNYVLGYIKAHANEEATCYLIPMCEDVNAAIDMLTPAVRNSAFAAYYKPAKEMADRQAKQKEMEKKTAEGTVAPDFTLKDINGKDFKLSSLRGKYVLLDFWGSWCGWCIKALPNMKECYDKNSKNGKFEIVSIDCNDTEEKWKAAVKQHDMSWTQVKNENKDGVPTMYGVSGFPTFVLISPDGKIAKRYVGSSPDMYKYIDSLSL